MALSKIVRDSLNTGIDDNSDATAITIDSSENVGIGTASPARTLTVNGSGNRVSSITHTAGAYAFATFSDANTSNDGSVRVGALTNDLVMFSGGSETARLLSGGGLTFNGDTAAANALDDYEQGTWTPSIGGSATYNNGNDGRYVKVGGIVHCTFLANINSRGTGSEYRLSGLPFASQNTGFVHSGCVSYFANLNSNVTFVGFYVESNATTMQFVCATGSAGPTIAGNGFSVFKNSTVVYGAVSYPTDA
jgi:hypothetical protein